MKGQHYGTLAVQRCCVVPGMLVRHEGKTWKAGVNRKGKLILSSLSDSKVINDNEVEILLDGHGNPLGDYPRAIFEVIYHDRDYTIADVISNFIKKPETTH